MSEPSMTLALVNPSAMAERLITLRTRTFLRTGHAQDYLDQLHTTTTNATPTDLAALIDDLTTRTALHRATRRTP